MAKKKESIVETPEWSTLYKIAGSAAVLMVVFIPIQVIVFIVWPPPDSVIGWFTLFQNNRIVGLLDMDFLLLVDQILFVPIILALYVLLRRTNISLATIGLTLGFLGVAIYFASGVAFEMLSLSDLYAAAATETEQAMCMASGQAMLATWQGTAFNFGYITQAAGILLIAAVMVRSTVFSKTTAWMGVAMGVLSLVPPTVPVAGMFFAFGSLIPLIAWNILVARRLFGLAKT